MNSAAMNTSLKDYLMAQPAGADLDLGEVEFLLAEVWRSLRGSHVEGMRAEKIRGRTEKLAWNPPLLTFTIERHGGTVNGSTRAELQNWCVDISAHTTELVSKGRRQLHATATRVNVKGPAAEIAEAILENAACDKLKRYPDGRVKVVIGAVIPHDGFKQTISGRRKRFRAALEGLIKEQGWVEVGFNTYERKQAS